MSFLNPALRPNPNEDHNYHPLPDSDSPSSPTSTDHHHLKHDEIKTQAPWPAEAITTHPEEAQSQMHNPRLNKYALAGAILASTNSILLGYGQ